MITMQELLGKEDHTLNPELMNNLVDLHKKINEFRSAYGKPLRVTSGLRSMKHHLAIYAAKGITDHSKIPMKSNHLVGLACDLVPIEDDIKHLQDWILDNIKLMEGIGLYFEDFSVTTSWVHCQIVQPKSGKRFFLP